MINPYAQTFMIAARQDHRIAPQRLMAARDPKPGKRMFRLFGRRRDLDPKNFEPPEGGSRLVKSRVGCI